MTNMSYSINAAGGATTAHISSQMSTSTQAAVDHNSDETTVPYSNLVDAPTENPRANSHGTHEDQYETDSPREPHQHHLNILLQDSDQDREYPSPSVDKSSSFSCPRCCSTNKSKAEHRDNTPLGRKGRLVVVIRAAVSELIATFLLIYMVCGIDIAAQSRGDELGTIMILNAAVAGLTVSFCIYAFFPISGAHMNPAITLSLFLTGHTSLRRTLIYIMAQMIGGQLAMLALLSCFHHVSGLFTLVALIPAQVLVDVDSDVYTTVALFPVFWMELIGTFILVLVNFKAAVDKFEEDDTVFDTPATPRRMSVLLDFSASSGSSKLPVVPISIAMGATVATLVAISQASSRGGFNPVRYLSTATWSGEWPGWYCYLSGQLLGACLACLLHWLLDSLLKYGNKLKVRSRKLMRERRQQEEDVQQGATSIKAAKTS